MSCLVPFHRMWAFSSDLFSLWLTLSRKDDLTELRDVSELDDHEVENEVRENEGGVAMQDWDWRIVDVVVAHSCDVSSDIDTGGGNGGNSDQGNPSSS